MAAGSRPGRRARQARRGRPARPERAEPGRGRTARDLLDDDHDYRAAKVDAWLAHALAPRSGHYTDPAARAAALGLLPVPVRARAALLAALARTGTPIDGDVEFVERLAQADPDATTALAAWLDNAAAVKGVTA
ncbi:hypothetical protein AB0F42_33240 [Streptomyces buecherae]|uniref:hypothetical protein n=1 Tax=Streptomyces buecherae TaxID=2763006 RepID=UPI0033F5ED42